MTPISGNDFASPGNTISQILASSTSGSVSDPDGDEIGVAIFSAEDSNGKWEFSLDSGGTWNPFDQVPFGQVARASALLLDADAVVRFIPDPGYNGPAAISYRLWDQTSGNEGQRIDASTNSCLLYTSPSPRDLSTSRMPSSA